MGEVPGTPRVDLDEVTDSDEAAAVLALPADNGFVATIAEALVDPQDVQWVTNAKEILGATQQRETSVLVIDAAVGVSQLPPFVSNLKRARPNLVIIVAGERADSSDLIELVSSGHVFRLLFKPLSQGLTRLAIEAGLLREAADPDPDTTETAEDSFDGLRWWLPYAVGGALMVTLVAALLAWLMIDSEPALVSAQPPDAEVAAVAQPPVAPATPPARPEPQPVEQAAPQSQTQPGPTEQLLARARLAIAEGRYVVPAEDNAAAHYRQVLVLEPDNPEARSGLESITDALLARAEQALVEGRPEEAREALGAASEVQPSHHRIAFLTSQIDKEDQRELIAEALRVAERGEVATAAAMLEQVALARPEMAEEVDLGRDKLAGIQAQAQVDELLERGRASLEAGRLIRPADDSASFYYQSILELEPANADATAGLGDVGEALVGQARAATRAGDFGAARKRLDEAGELGVQAPGLASARRELRAAAERKKNLQLLELGRERLEQKRLVEPAEDSAKHYLLAFAAIEPDNAELQQSLERLSTELTGRAGAELARREFDAAERWIGEAIEVGVRADAVAELRQSLDTERQIAALPSLVRHNELLRLEFVAPEYPRRARARNVEGKVRMEFAVATSGVVESIEVTESDPEGWFEKAAMAALEQWRYEPTVIGGRAIPRRAWVLVEFKLED